jgi:hypothetical protein
MVCLPQQIFLGQRQQLFSSSLPVLMMVLQKMQQNCAPFVLIDQLSAFLDS